jgi:cell division septation protein DedD
MADDPKQPHDPPPLADKGEARPLSRSEAGDGKSAEPWSAKRPSGVHTPPDLYGARSVIRRPMETPAAAGAEPQKGPQSMPRDHGDRGDAGDLGDLGDLVDMGDADDLDAAELRREAADPLAQGGGDTKTPTPPSTHDKPSEETIGAPQGTERRAAESAPPAPAANLLDHPPRVPDSLAFEDLAGARQPEPQAAASPMGREWISDPRQPKGEAPGAAARRPVAGTADDRVDDTIDPGRTPSPPQPESGLAGKLLAWLEAEANLSRLRDNPRLLAIGAAGGVAVLAMFAAVGLFGGDEDAAQQAQGLDAPATLEAQPLAQDLAEDPAEDLAEDPAGAAETARQDLPVAPAGSNFGLDEPSRVGPDRPAAVVADRTGGSQIATLPDPQEPAAPAQDRAPIVDFMRIDPDGKAVVAGRAAPGTELIVLDNGEPLGSITADIYGLWTFVSDNPLASGRHEIGLRVKRKGSEVSDPVLVTESGAGDPGGPGGPGEPEAAAESLAPASGGASGETALTSDAAPAASDQLAAAEPEATVRSDETEMQELAEAATAAEAAELGESGESGEAANAGAPEPIEIPEPTAPAAAAATAAASDAASDLAAAPETDVAPEARAPVPAPKPEPPKSVQTAALPAGGDYVVQLASFRNPETAVREQEIVEEKFSDLLSGHEIFVQQADLAEQGTYYRVRLGPFASMSDARELCARFQERDHDCLALAR